MYLRRADANQSTHINNLSPTCEQDPRSIFFRSNLQAALLQNSDIIMEPSRVANITNLALINTQIHTNDTHPA